MKYEIQFQSFSKVSDDELLRRLSELLQKSRRVEAELVAHIGEVDARRLYAREAGSSMFVYCTERLNLSEHEAYLRIGVARAARRYPMLLDILAEGRLPLSAIARLAPHLTEDNRDTVLARAVGKSKREIEELVAELSPGPDVPTKVRKLPEHAEKAKPTASPELVPERVTFLHTPAPTQPTSPAQRPVVQPLSSAKYKIQFTASAELRDKLERLRDLMRSSVPDGDLAAIIEDAVTEKLERLEAKRFAKTKSPRKSVERADTSPKSRSSRPQLDARCWSETGTNAPMSARTGNVAPGATGLSSTTTGPLAVAAIIARRISGWCAGLTTSILPNVTTVRR